MNTQALRSTIYEARGSRTSRIGDALFPNHRIEQPVEVAAIVFLVIATLDDVLGGQRKEVGLGVPWKDVSSFIPDFPFNAYDVSLPLKNVVLNQVLL